jgi:phosphatidylserine decarboxylase
VQTEVGALLIGKIKNNKKSTFRKNEEKGYFEFGGSTIVVLINKDIEFDEDIAKMNEQGIEIQVRAGERIGIKKE